MPPIECMIINIYIYENGLISYYFIEQDIYFLKTDVRRSLLAEDYLFLVVWSIYGSTFVFIFN